MANLNKVFLIGNLTKDPEIKYTPGGTAIASFSLACNRRYKVKEETKEEVLFIECDSFGKTAELIGQHVRKGNPLFIEGRLKQDTWEREGKRLSKIKVVVENIQFLNKKEETKETEEGDNY